ncbi:MAG: prepilin-type N-terminal cleavage/methylation domain-containing protein [Clostridia bacterium]|nr:prepilin-type N-terminal cleavage/methylation domain-containing protein [Clostridia bacterium]
MSELHKNKATGKRGFTIVELSIVIAVIAILAAILVPTFATIFEKANKTSALQNAKNTVAEYIAEFDKNPEDGSVIYDGSDYFILFSKDGTYTTYDYVSTDENYSYISNEYYVFEGEVATVYNADAATINAGIYSNEELLELAFANIEGESDTDEITVVKLPTTTAEKYDYYVVTEDASSGYVLTEITVTISTDTTYTYVKDTKTYTITLNTPSGTFAACTVYYNATEAEE